MLGDARRIPGAAVTPLLPLAYYSVVLGQTPFCYLPGAGEALLVLWLCLSNHLQSSSGPFGC